MLNLESRWILSALPVPLVIGLAACDREAEPLDLEIDRYSVELHVQPDGAYHVTEQITFDARTGSFTFGSRTIPTRGADAVVDIHVESPDMGPLDVSTRSRAGLREARWEHAPREGSGTVVLSYRVEGALRDLVDRNEIEWAAVGPDWEVPIRRVDVLLTLPADFAQHGEALEAEPDAMVGRDGERWALRFSHGALEPGEGFQLRVALPRVMAGRPQGLRRPEVQGFLAGLALGLLGLLAGMRGHRRWLGEELWTGAPPALRLDEAAVLLHSGAGGATVFPALVLDLARRGHLSLERMGSDANAEGRDGAGGDEAAADQEERLVASIHRKEEDALSPFESALLVELERYESLERMGEEATAFRTKTLDAMRRAAVESGWLEDRSPQTRRDRRLGLLAFAAAAVLLIAIIWTTPLLMAGSFAFLGLGLGLLVRSGRKWSPTAEGRRVQGEILGWLALLREELERGIESDPVEVTRRYVQVLPWLSIDPRHTGRLETRLRETLEAVEDDFAVPEWTAERSREARETIDERSDAARSFDRIEECCASVMFALIPAMAHASGVASSVATASSPMMVGAPGSVSAGGGGGRVG